MSIKKKEEKVIGDYIRAALPAIGLLLALAFGAISWVLAPQLLGWTVRNVSGFTGREMPGQTMRLIFAAFIFLVLSGFAGGVVALALPRKKSRVKESDLAKEKADMRREKQRRRKRQKELARQNRSQPKNSGK